MCLYGRLLDRTLSAIMAVPSAPSDLLLWQTKLDSLCSCHPPLEGRVSLPTLLKGTSCCLATWSLQELARFSCSVVCKARATTVTITSLRALVENSGLLISAGDGVVELQRFLHSQGHITKLQETPDGYTGVQQHHGCHAKHPLLFFVVFASLIDLRGNW